MHEEGEKEGGLVIRTIKGHNRLQNSKRNWNPREVYWEGNRAFPMPGRWGTARIIRQKIRV